MIVVLGTNVVAPAPFWHGKPAHCLETGGWRSIPAQLYSSNLRIVGNLVYAANTLHGLQVYRFPAEFGQVRLENINLIPGLGFEMRLTGPIDSDYEISQSSDLDTWEPVTQVRITSGSVQVSAPIDSSAGWRFFRAERDSR